MGLKVVCSKCGYVFYKLKMREDVLHHGTIKNFLMNHVYNRFGCICPKCGRPLPLRYTIIIRNNKRKVVEIFCDLRTNEIKIIK